MKLLLLVATLCLGQAFAATAILPVDSSSVSVQQSGKDFAYSIQQNRGAVAVGAAPLAAPAPVVAVAERLGDQAVGGRLTQAYIEGEKARLSEKNEGVKAALRAQAQTGALVTGSQLIERGHSLGLKGIELKNLQLELFPTFIIPKHYYEIYEIPYIIY